MTSPRIEVDLGKIRHNAKTIAGRLKTRGISMTGVTKAVCGHPAIAQTMLDGGAIGLAEARLSNVGRLRNAHITCPITLIRTPMPSQVDDVVQLCDTSYNTEIDVIAGLAAAAIRHSKVHDVILMVEMGDLREGILPADVGAIAQKVVKMPGVALKGIAANFACLNKIAPTAEKMAALSDLASEIEGLCGPYIETVSGGNSANLPWALGKQQIGRVNDLRLGEAILLGNDPITGEKIGGLYSDAFTLIAEIIETDTHPAAPPIALVSPALAKLRLVSNDAGARRVIFALGQQDTDISGLSIPAGTALIGATSDHLVIATHQSRLKVGTEMRFPMNYQALMRAMAAPDVQTELRDDRNPRHAPLRREAKHLALI